MIEQSPQPVPTLALAWSGGKDSALSACDGFVFCDLLDGESS